MIGKLRTPKANFVSGGPIHLGAMLLCLHPAGVLSAQSLPAKAAPQWVTPTVRAPRLEQVIFQSAATGADVSYFIYKPAAYDAAADRRFPVLYWLHGSGGGLAGVPRLVTHFDTAIRDGKIPPMLVVFPNGMASSMWCDSKDGKVPMETVIVRDLLPHVDARFRTIPSRQGRIVEGFSMGGYGAARLGFKRTDLFAAVSILGGGPLQKEFKVAEAPRASAAGAQRLLDAVYGGDQEYFMAQSPWRLAEQNSAALREGTLVRQVVGELDETLANNRELHLHLTRLKIPHTFTTLPNVPHNPMQLFQALGEANWRFYRAALATPASR